MKVLGKSTPSSDLLFAFTQGIDVDSRLFEQEIRVQRAWLGALVKAGYLSGEESVQIDLALDEALRLMRQGLFDWKVEDEDIHMNLERFVTEKAGDLGKRMHVGRSRNDLIATTLRLFVRDTLDELRARTRTLVAAIADRAQATLPVIVPGLTHLQAGQPIRFGHCLAAHGHAFRRDIRRMEQAGVGAMDRLPLGSAALAGTHLAVDLGALAAELGFEGPSVNSYDSVGDRDFLVEALGAISLLGTHLGRLSEDLIYWSSTAVGLVKLPEAWSTGSSIMPNKRNPDVPELVRAKASRMIAASVEAQMILKNVASSYGSDLHEMKRTFLSASDEAMACLAILAPFMAGLSVCEKRARAMLGHGHVLATEIANELVEQGMPFRNAYLQVAAHVAEAERDGTQVHELPAVVEGAGRMTFESCVEKRKGPGGTAMSAATAGIDRLRD